MSNISDEITQLKLRIIELENQEKKMNEMNNKNSISYNFNIINDFLVEKKNAIKNNRYSKSIPLARYYDEEKVKYLEAIFNILHIFEKRIENIERK